MNSKPLLSICIPTYNRSKYLKKCIDAIIQQDRFNEIEVIISDNCSTDATESVGKKFQKLYPNIFYFRNDKNELDKNLPLSLRRAKGSLRKLTNDTVIYSPGAISYMLEAAEENINSKKQIYFLSTENYKSDRIDINTLDEYINIVSYNLTWIRSMAIWEEDCDDLSIYEKNSISQMGQIPFLLFNFEKHNGAVIYNRPIMDSLPVNKKNVSYGLFKVFYENFLGFIKQYVDEGKIKSITYENLRKTLLFDFFSSWIIHREFDSDIYLFSDEDLSGLVKKAYKNERYYFRYCVLMFIRRTKRKIKSIVR